MKKLFNLPKIIQYLYYALFLVTPLIMSSKTSEIFEFNKMMTIYLVTIVIGTLYLVHIAQTRSKMHMVPYFIGVLLLFLATQIFSAWHSIDPHTSIFGYYGRWNGGVISIIAYIVLFFVFIQVSSKKVLSRLLNTSLIGSSLVMLWGLFARFGIDFSCLLFTGQLSNSCWTSDFQPAERMFATIGQPNWLGAYLAIHFFIGFYFFIKELQFDRKNFAWTNSLIYAIYLVVDIFSLIFTRSRSALVAVAISSAIGIVLVVASKIRVFPKAVFISLIGMLVISGLVIVSPFVLHAPSSSNSNELNVTDSFEIRKIVWQGALDLGKHYPLTGSGVETFAYAYYFTRPLAHNLTSEWDFIYNKAHNEYLNYFATTGYPGVFAYLALILAVCVLYYMRYAELQKKNISMLYRDSSFYLFLAYISILITNFFGFSTSTIQLFFYLIPAFLLTGFASNKAEVSESKHKSKVPVIGYLTSILVVFCGSVLVYQWGCYYRADVLYTRARVEISSSEYSQALTNLNDALKLKKEHIYEDKLSNVLAYLSFESSFDNKEQSNDLIKLSKIANMLSIAGSPQNVLYWKTRARNYYLYYQVTHDNRDLETSAASMENAVRIAPTDVQTYYSLAVLYVALGQETEDKTIAKGYSDKARATLVKIFEMKPDYREAQKLGGEI